MTYRLRPSAFEAMPGWRDDDSVPALAALQRSASYLSVGKPYRTGALGISVADFAPSFAALQSPQPSAETARAFFERHFVPCRIVLPEQRRGFVTAFYEPEVKVSAVQGGAYRFPFYRRPDDLADVDAADAPALHAAGFAHGRRTPGGLVEYYDRTTIERGALAGRDREIAWAADRVDVFFAHIQGAARLVHEEGPEAGRVQRITYAAKSGHPFTAIGRVLVDCGEIAPDAVTMASLRAWLAAHPERLDEILWQNRSFIFFREADGADLDEGPIAAAKVALTAGRSLAVDRPIHTFATPFFVDAPALTHLSAGQPFRRLMIAQDTGSAIVGPARGDIFTGSGSAAGDLAGSVRHQADFTILLPKPAAARLL